MSGEKKGILGRDVRMWFGTQPRAKTAPLSGKMGRDQIPHP